jgi:predicted RNase H-like HicB family nuclease
MRTFKFVVERDPETDLLVGYVPGWPGAHSQGADIDELQRNLREVIEMLLEDGEPRLEAEFVDVRLGRHLKSGQASTGQNRPPESAAAGRIGSYRMRSVHGKARGAAGDARRKIVVLSCVG